MNANQENKLTMYKAVLAMLSTFQPVYATNAPLTAKITALTALYDDAEQHRNNQMQLTSGVTTTKKKAKQKTVALMMPIVGALRVYAQDTNDLEILGAFTNSVTYYTQLRDTACAMEAKRLSSTANAFATQLLPYGVSSAMLSDLASAISDYEAVLSAPRVRILKRAASTIALQNTIDECDMLLKQIDDSILLYANSNPDLHTQHKQARKIINLGHRYTSAKLVFMQSLEDDAELVAPIRVILSNNNGVYVVDTNTTEATIETMRAGTYNVDIESTSYTMETLSVSIKSGIVNTVELSIKPTLTAV